jgi:hypothetical protein
MAVPYVVLIKHADRHDELTDISWQLLALNAPEFLLRIFTWPYVYHETKQQEPE